MAKRSRPLGLSKSRKQQKLNTSQEQEETDSNKREEKSTTPQLNIELEENENADNTAVQLIGLWNSYLDGARDSDALLNGIVNECDTLLSNNNNNNDNKTDEQKQDDQFLSVFALALSELTIFNAEKIKEYFDDSIDILKLYSSSSISSNLLDLTESKIIFQRIPLEYIQKLEQDHTLTQIDVDLNNLLKLGKSKFESFTNLLNDLQNIGKYQNEKFIHGLIIENIVIFNDLLDIIENFGSKKNLDEGIDSDDENEENNEEEDDQIRLTPSHPLYIIQQQLNDHAKWLRNSMCSFLPYLHKDTPNYYNIAKLVGESYLKEAEFFSETYLEMKYGGEEEEEEEEVIDEDSIKAAQSEGIQFVEKAIEYLTLAQDPENADSWAQLAEAYIDLGNLQDNESKEQEQSYKKAETILEKANIASHNKYKHILDNLNSDALSKDVEKTNI